MGTQPRPFACTFWAANRSPAARPCFVRTLRKPRMADVHYHIAQPGPRSRYMLAHLLGTMAGWQAEEVPDAEAFRNVETPKLVYGHQALEGAFHVVPCGLLEQAGLMRGKPGVESIQGMPQLFPTKGGHLSFDPFSAAFFLLSRMEEYGFAARDGHGRPLARELHGARHGYLERPVVDEWLLHLAAAWRRADPRVPALRRKYMQTATLDVDNGAMYLGREWWRSAGAAVRDLLHGRPGSVRDRLAVLAGAKADPYAVHAAFLDVAERTGARAIVNFLVADRGRYDHAISLRSPFLQDVLRQVVRRASVGLHPGYGSSDAPARMAVEKQRLEEHAGVAVTQSRQHYLRMKLPGTYRALEQVGIREEHSMGMADAVGFRAGTCTPYPFYDLEAEASTALTIHPFAVMDSVPAYKLRLTPQEAVIRAKQLVDAVRAVQGTFISVWHERFLSGYGDEAGWQGVAPEVLEYARP